MSAAVLVSSCKGRVFTTLPLAVFVRLWYEVLGMPWQFEERVPAKGYDLAEACARVLREIHRGRGAEFFDPSEVPAMTRRLLELGTVGNEAGAGLVSWR